MYEKRGVSPMVATILLVAMVFVIALIVFLWFRGLTQEAVTKFDKNAEIVCNEVAFQASYSNGVLGISNSGNVPIYDLKVKLSQASSSQTLNLRDMVSSWPQFGLVQGGAFSSNINTQGATQITVIPVLLGSVKSGQEKTYICNEAKYGYSVSV